MRAASIALLSLALVAHAAALPRGQEIVGGTEVNPPFRYGFMASLQRNGRHFCGGTVLNAGTLLTAAHCSTGFTNNRTQGLTVSVHRHDLRKNSSSENGCDFTVSEVFVHPNYDAGKTSHDVSIWKLVPGPLCTPTVLSALPTVHIDDGEHSAPDTNMTTMGWGTTGSWARPSPVLLEVQVPVVTEEACKTAYSDSQIDETMICAGFVAGGKDSCQGDSGSFFGLQIGENEFVQTGVVSWGRGCALPKYYGVYARVAFPALREFITKFL